jgi:hypothetical protein
MNLLNIIQYLFCERLFGQVLLIEKSAAGKVRQKKCDKKKSAAKKSRKKKCDRKIVAEKSRVWQKSAVEKSRQKNGGYLEEIWHKNLGGMVGV